MGHASRSGSLLRLEASHARVSLSGLKTGGGAMMSGYIEWRLHRVKAKDEWIDAMGCIRPFYPIIIIFSVLGPRGNLVFYSFAWAYK
jgi:hypothetical protein